MYSTRTFTNNIKKCSNEGLDCSNCSISTRQGINIKKYKERIYTNKNFKTAQKHIPYNKRRNNTINTSTSSGIEKATHEATLTPIDRSEGLRESSRSSRYAAIAVLEIHVAQIFPFCFLPVLHHLFKRKAVVDPAVLLRLVF